MGQRLFGVSSHRKSSTYGERHAGPETSLFQLDRTLAHIRRLSRSVARRVGEYHMTWVQPGRTRAALLNAQASRSLRDFSTWQTRRSRSSAISLSHGRSIVSAVWMKGISAMWYLDRLTTCAATFIL